MAKIIVEDERYNVTTIYKDVPDEVVSAVKVLLDSVAQNPEIDMRSEVRLR